ncbi:VOC family protein [Allostreptomyces psammosilenae]|uniref:Putative enzyme related to lactoylglutathione lyase n=1 Tax=Allostreptomyces psammosilenae TaxID=1892865 RepID=A0A852ZR64_9ACTN|nr:VOC family protein [Allostreptomyces psammosilenae]NYI04245.1 putative enzyme related to lactoylglutathione lyase [Allostreptomyces psammosilenae]
MIGTLGTVVLDCPDPVALAEFYAAVLGGTANTEDPEWTVLTLEGGTVLSFQLAPDHRPPLWPDPEHPQQFHLDVSVDDVDAAHERVLALGATFLQDRVGEDGYGWRVYADPAGHPFCLCRDRSQEAGAGTAPG